MIDARDVNDKVNRKPPSVAKFGNIDLLRLVFIGLAYFSANKIALLFPDAEKLLAVVWPAAGVGLAALLLSDRRTWTKVLFVIFLSGNIANLISGRPLINSLCFMTANCLETYCSAWIIVSMNGEGITFARIREILALVCAATLVNACTATVAAVIAFIAGIGPLRPFWLTWWVSDGLGILIVTPAIVGLSVNHANGTPRSSFSRVAETACFLGTIIYIAFEVFHHDLGRTMIGNFPFLLFALVAWGASRLSVVVLSCSFLVLAIIAFTGDAVSAGPLVWGGDNPQERMLIVQVFIGVLAVTGLFLSASIAEAKNALDSARVTGEHFRGLIEKAPEPIVLFDAGQGRLVDVNPAAERLFGCSRGELLHGGIDRFHAPVQPDLRTMAGPLAGCIQRATAGESVTLQLLIDTADNRKRLCEVHLVGLPSERGELIRATYLDITEKSEAQNRIAELAARLELATSSARLGIWDWNVEDDTLNWDMTMMALYGHTEETFPGGVDAWKDRLHPDDLESAWGKFQATLRGEIDWNTEFRIIIPGGEIRWVKADGIVIRDTHGSPVRMLGVNRDITESKISEEALRASEERYRKLFDTETDAILVVDMETFKFIDANMAALFLYGYTLEQFRSLGVTDISAEPEKSLEAVRSRRQMVITRLHRKKDGSTFTVDISGGYYNHGGRELHVAVVRDVSERVRRERVMKARFELLRFAHEHSWEETMQKALDEAEALTGSRIGFFHFVDPDQKSLSLQNWSTRTTEEFCRAEGKGLHYAIAEAGVWVDCIHQFRPVIHNCYQSIPHRKGLPTGHPEMVRELVVPVFRKGKIVAILGVGNKPTDYDRKDVDDITLLADMAWDIVEQKRAEESISASLARFEQFFNLFPEVACIGDSNGFFHRLNRAWTQIMGYESGDLAGASFIDFVHPEDIYHTLRAFERLISQDGPVYADNRFRHKDGSYRNLEWVAVKQKDTEFVYAAARDVTELVLQKEELDRSEERYRRLFDLVSEGIYVVDIESGRFIDANESALNLYGFSRDEFLRLRVTDISLEPEKTIDAISARQDHIPHRLHRRKDGTVISLEIFSSYTRFHDRQVLISALRDMTDRRRLEEEAKLAQAKLIQANKMASLGLLVSSIAHEINNPNNFILNNVTLLREAWSSSIPILDEYFRGNGEFLLGDIPYSQFRQIATRLYAGTVDGTQRINSIVDRLKKFVRQDRLTDKSHLDLNDVVSDSLEIMESEIRKNCDNFRLELEQGLPHAHGNPQQISQVLLNLLTNALQSLPKRSSGVQVRTGQTADGEWLYISVKDEGVGIPGEIMAHIREPFFSTKGDQGGTGLGLYISDSILLENRGQLSISSDPGDGTTVKVLLRRYDPDTF